MSIDRTIKQTTRVPGTQEQIEIILANGGGQVTLSTTTYPSLNSFEPQYWKFHAPWGLPGDELWLTEDCRIDKICQSNDGYTVTVKYKDETTHSYASSTSVALTAKNTWIPATGAIPDESIRCRCIIQDVNVQDTNWVFTVALLTI